MPKIPESVAQLPDALTSLVELRRIHQGKVRDTFALPGREDLMLVVATDRISIFDFVLPTLVPCKGMILAAMNHFWTEKVIKELGDTDMVACGAGIDEYLPNSLRRNAELQKRATVVRRLDPPEVEDIVRICLTGSGWASYQKGRTVCGHKLPQGLTDGCLLPFPIYTPTTKAKEGHDEHISADSVVSRFGCRRERKAIQFAMAVAAYAVDRGIILADTKFEFSGDVLVDEKCTPDSSRFWDVREWDRSKKKGKLPPSFDKQYVRNWGKTLGVDKKDPLLPDDVEFVHGLEVPEDVIKQTTLIYRYIFWRLTGRKIEDYQREVLGIDVPVPKLNIEVLVGSRSDIPQIKEGLEILKMNASVNVSVVSCHRNSEELRTLVSQGPFTAADVIIAGAGKAAALPGIVKSLICCLTPSKVPVIGVAFKGSTPEDDQAAKLSIKNLPEQPVELGADGEPYFGQKGFTDACWAALNDEFLPKDVVYKPAEFDIEI